MNSTFNNLQWAAEDAKIKVSSADSPDVWVSSFSPGIGPSVALHASLTAMNADLLGTHRRLRFITCLCGWWIGWLGLYCYRFSYCSFRECHLSSLLWVFPCFILCLDWVCRFVWDEGMRRVLIVLTYDSVYWSCDDHVWLTGRTNPVIDRLTVSTLWSRDR